MGWFSRKSKTESKVLGNKNWLFDGNQRISRIHTHEVNQEASPQILNPHVCVAGSKSAQCGEEKRGIPSINKYFWIVLEA